MKKQKIIALLLLMSILCSTIYCTHSRASELAVGGAVLASGGTALLGLLALSGVGMELENNRKFNELPDDEKLRIENSLNTNFEEEGLYRGYALEKIKTWVSDLQAGVLDKSSEIYDYFKDWATDVNLTKSSANNPADDYAVGAIPASVVFPLTITNKAGNTTTLNYDDVTKTFFDNNVYNGSLVYATFRTSGNYNGYLSVNVANRADNGYRVVTYSTFYYGSNGTVGGWSVSNPTTVDDIIINNTLLKSYGNDDIMITVNGVTQSGNYIDSSADVVTYFSTNTDYLERLKGKNEPIEVIDVTDIKHPIVVSQPNTVANIDWNRGMKNNKNDDDNNNTVGALVPANVWYEHLDDYIEEQNNAIIEYDNSINQNPEDADKIFISPTPIINVNNYNNTLPVINYPVPGTVVNNNYEFNNINNNNITIYELPYNTDLIPMLPTLFFENKFPFCIPWDIYSFIKIFDAEPQAPHFEIPFPYMNEYGLQTYPLVIDLSDYNIVSHIFRVMFFILFIVGLMMGTRKLIKG